MHSGSNEYVYLNYGNGFMGIFICLNSLSYTLNMQFIVYQLQLNKNSKFNNINNLKNVERNMS